MKYRKKPVVIEAVQYDGNFRCLDIFSIDDVGKFIVGKEEDGSPYLIIPTLEGEHKCSKWDYVIKGVKGEYYPCKLDIFEMTYERDEPTVIQAPINNYDVWDEVIDQVGGTNEMIDHIGDSNGMVDQVPDVGKMVSDTYTGDYPFVDDISFGDLRNVDVDSFYKGYNKAKETLFTKEEVQKMIDDAHYEGQYLHAKSVTKQMMRDNSESYSNAIIQSLKQPKQ